MSNPARLDVQQADTVKVIYEDQELMLPVVEGSEGERGIDISKLRGQSGLVTLDEGYVNTGSTRSGITYLDGEKGILRYRGYPIEQLAAKSDFIETAYLLIHGELPTAKEAEAFRAGIREHTMIHEDMRSFYNGFPRDAHPMAILSSVVSIVHLLSRCDGSTGRGSGSHFHRSSHCETSNHCGLQLQKVDGATVHLPEQ